MLELLQLHIEELIVRKTDFEIMCEIQFDGNIINRLNGLACFRQSPSIALLATEVDSSTVRVKTGLVEMSFALLTRILVF